MKKAAALWICGLHAGDKEHMQMFDGKTSWKTAKGI
jgi:hypothetical protein